MPFVAGKCPQCGGDLQLDKEIETGFCMHCGSKIIVQDAIRAVRIDNSSMIETWMKMGFSAANGGNYKEANDYFTKVVENDPNNWQAIFQKGRSAAWGGTYGDSRLLEFFQGIEDAQKIINNINLPENERIEAMQLFAYSISELTLMFVGTIEEVINSYGDIYMENLHFIEDAYTQYINCINYYDRALVFLNGMNDENAESIRSSTLIGICVLCRKVCTLHPFVPPGHWEATWFWGLTIEEKQKYISRYDELRSEIRMVDPEFEKDNFIDRLEVPMVAKSGKFYIGEERIRKNRSLQEEIDQEYIKKETENQQKKYWEDHPNEYKAHIQELTERKNQLETEIKNKEAQLREMKNRKNLEIDQLLEERSKLGIFSGKRKNEIDLRVNELRLENDNERISREINKLKNDLDSIKE
jgi:tetratricopeptide (TPR) repeat protein